MCVSSCNLINHVLRRLLHRNTLNGGRPDIGRAPADVWSISGRAPGSRLIAVRGPAVVSTAPDRHPADTWTDWFKPKITRRRDDVSDARPGIGGTSADS